MLPRAQTRERDLCFRTVGKSYSVPLRHWADALTLGCTEDSNCSRYAGCESTKDVLVVPEAQVEAFLKARNVTREEVKALPAVRWNDGVLDDDACAVMAYLFTTLAGKLPDRGADEIRLPITELRLNDNKLAGTIPAAINNFASLVSIDLDDNQLTTLATMLDDRCTTHEVKPHMLGEIIMMVGYC